MLDRSCLEIFHRDLPYLKPTWRSAAGLFEGLLEKNAAAKLEAIASPPPDLAADALFRIALPYNLQPGKAKKTIVFCTTEGGIVTNSMLAGMGVASIQEALGEDVTIMTPSHWSKSGFLRSGVDESRLVVIPHGVDTNIYKPLPEAERIAVRRELGLEGYFAFLNIGILSPNKGIRPLLKAFAAIADRYPQARLVLKGADSMFESQKFLREAAQAVLTEAEAAKVEPRLAYLGKSLSFAEMIRLYQAVDAYVSPYLAEGFNMPVLEAAACGLPVICTKGGPTDDFTHRDFALPIESQLQPLAIAGETVFILVPDLEHLINRMEQAIERSNFRQQARHAGPSFVAANFTWKQVVNQLIDSFEFLA
ncbi:MAG: glycosyltransferase family 4 protein [Oscillatoria sp. SIO1A7]|nr:glycosyltransferase family 4 protein [Oscillatoria sp. SIO1A7]